MMPFGIVGFFHVRVTDAEEDPDATKSAGVSPGTETVVVICSHTLL